ncbi:hypothetical protein Lal_00047818 [Lupinus albus]|nr:hypothetical protein Lal_00047818 [Lupinus albus]
MDPYKALNIILNPDGTLTRVKIPPQNPPSSDPNLPVLSKDIPINRSKHTWSRIFLPHTQLHHKLPLIVFYHGGGFILYSASSTYFHDFCINLANSTKSIIVSVEYRLAPEHRLPAAYDDSVEALQWIKDSKDSWLTNHADYSRTYLMGESAGGNIAYNVALRAAAEIDQIKPLKIKGLILIQPFFGGKKRTGSELRLAEDGTLPLPVTDLMWNLSLPVGADRDHEYSNEAVNGERCKVLGQGWRVGVFGCDGDPLVDRQIQLLNLLKANHVNVTGQFYPGGRHGIFIGDPSMSAQVFHFLNNLLS